MNKLLVCALSFILLVSLFGCTKELEDKSYDVTPSPNVSIEQGLKEDTQPTQTEQAEQPQPQQTIEEPPTLLPCATFDLPESIDPLGVFGDEDIFRKTHGVIITKYNAYPETIEDLYVIRGVEIGKDHFTRVFVKATEEKVEEVITYCDTNIDDLFDQMRMFYGDPTNVYIYRDGDYSNKVELKKVEWDILDSGFFGEFAVWDMDDYFVELGVLEQQGCGTRFDYIYIGVEPLNDDDFFGRRSDVYLDGLETHPNRALLFDPTGLYRDESLFDLTLEEFLNKYHAAPAEHHDLRFRLGDTVSERFVIDDVSVLSKDATFIISFREDYRREYADELIDYVQYRLQDESIDDNEFHALLNNIVETIEADNGTPTSIRDNAYVWKKVLEGCASTELRVDYNEDRKTIVIIMHPA